jgi:hypothetical protein
MAVHSKTNELIRGEHPIWPFGQSHRFGRPAECANSRKATIQQTSIDVGFVPSREHVQQIASYSITCWRGRRPHELVLTQIFVRKRTNTAERESD